MPQTANDFGIPLATLTLSSGAEALLLGRQEVDSIGKEEIFPRSGMPSFTTGRRHGLLQPQLRRSHTAIASKHESGALNRRVL